MKDVVVELRALGHDLEHRWFDPDPLLFQDNSHALLDLFISISADCTVSVGFELETNVADGNFDPTIRPRMDDPNPGGS